MEIHLVKKKLKITAVLNAISILLSITSPFLEDILNINYLHLFVPWIAPGKLLAPSMVAVSLLTVALFMGSRVGAVALLIIYLLERIILFLLVFGYFDAVASVLWLFVTLTWGLVLTLGVRWTYQYHSAKAMSEDRPTRK